MVKRWLQSSTSPAIPSKDNGIVGHTVLYEFVTISKGMERLSARSGGLLFEDDTRDDTLKSSAHTIYLAGDR